VATKGPWDGTDATKFGHPDEAAKDWARRYNGDSIKKDKEYGTTIFRTKDGRYAYSEPAVGNKNTVRPSPPPLKDKDYNGTAGVIHSHAAYHQPDDNDFSEHDWETSDETKIPFYMVTPNGHIQKYDPNKKTTLKRIDCDGVPVDKNVPGKYR